MMVHNVDVTCTTDCKIKKPLPSKLLRSSVKAKPTCLIGATGDGPEMITASTALDYVAVNQNCELVTGWDFQWSL